MKTPLSTCLVGTVLLAACIRSTEPVPPRGEGGFVTGDVLARDLATAETVPVSGAQVRAIGTSVAQVTDQRGFFELSRLPLGRVHIAIARSAASGQPALGRILDPVTLLVDGQTLDLGGIEILGTGTLGGSVGLESGGAISAAPGALVVIAQTTFKGIAGTDGRYLIPGLPEGTVDVVAFYPGYAPAHVAGVHVSPGVESLVQSLDLSASMGTQSLTVRGTALLEGRADSSGIVCTFIDEQRPQNAPVISTMTVSDGSYQGSAPPGVYRARFTHDGYRSVEIPGVAVLPEGVVGLVPVTLSAGSDSTAGKYGCPPDQDQFPNDPFACKDTDGDKIPDDLDPDIDGDGLSNAEEVTPGLDGWITDPLNPDTDGDGFNDKIDNCPTVPNPDQKDSNHDGIGDACESLRTGPGSAVVLGFSPASGHEGDEIRIVGRGFVPAMSFNAVRFGVSGPIATSTAITSTTVLVRVPADAESGPLSVYSGGQVATSTGSFHFVRQPSVVDFDPHAARRHGMVAVFTRNTTMTAGLSVTVNGAIAQVQTDLSGNPIVEQVFVAGEALQRFRFTVPDDATTGPIRVATTGQGSSRPSAMPLVILSGPEIRQTQPNPCVLQETMLILGRGFATDDTGGSVKVSFPGVAADQTPALVLDSTIRVIVPQGTTSGDLVVKHPAGNASIHIDVGSMMPVVTQLSPTIAIPGAMPAERVTLTGDNLQTTTAVMFTGGATSPNISVTQAIVTADVPAGAQPGPVTLTLAGAMTVASPEPLRILVRTPSATLLDNGAAVGGGVSGDGRTLFVVTSALNGHRVDTTTLMEQGTPTPLTFLPPTAFVRSMQVSPDGTSGIITTTINETWVVDLPSFSLRGHCTDGVSASDFSTFTFDGSSQLAYSKRPARLEQLGQDGVFRVDLTPTPLGQRCAVVGQSAFTPGLSGVVAHSPGYVVLGHSTMGMALMDVRPISGEEGTLVVSFTGTPIDATAQLFESADGLTLFYKDVSSPFVKRISLYSSAMPDTAPAGDTSEVLQSQTRSFLVSSGAIFDLNRFEPAYTNPIGQFPRLAAAHPTSDVFFTLDNGGAILRYEIKQ
jgi:hypothetical protein